MHRTNIYLTEEQERAVAARARRSGTTRSAVIREILDRELASAPDAEVKEALGRLAVDYHDLARHLFADDPDLRIER